MKLKQNLLKNINSIAVGFGLIGFTALTDVAKAEAPPKCTDATVSYTHLTLPTNREV